MLSFILISIGVILFLTFLVESKDSLKKIFPLDQQPSVDLLILIGCIIGLCLIKQ